MTTRIRSSESAQKLCNVDLLRGIAAIAILFWHYQHFYFPEAGITTIAGKPAVQPLYQMFSWFYMHGAWAVQFFWMLSGFVFFHVYRSRADVSLREFAGARFSRLYPLHFITLCIVAVLQLISWLLLGKFQIYPWNDAYHFALNLFMASHWGFQEGYSFNAPIWSISVEILVYALFFAFLRTTGIRFLPIVAWLLLALMLTRVSSAPVVQCAAFFAFGGLVHQVHEVLDTRWGGRVNLGAALGSMLLTMTALLRGWVPLASALHWGIFPCLIWLAVALENSGISSDKLGLGLGNITYSSYLIHVPVQIVVMLILDAFVGSRGVVNSSVFLVGYIATVLVLASIVYRYIELPLKQASKGWFVRRRLTVTES